MLILLSFCDFFAHYHVPELGTGSRSAHDVIIISRSASVSSADGNAAKPSPTLHASLLDRLWGRRGILTLNTLNCTEAA
jgi:hypothetical protein